MIVANKEATEPMVLEMQSTKSPKLFSERTSSIL
jgi:hypothetical protein